MTKNNKIEDCIIIGGGIGGLTAGVYLARFRCDIKLIDRDDSRAALIPTSHNYPGFPQGISGKNLLALLRDQYYLYGGTIIKDTALRIKRDQRNNIFSVETDKSTLRAKYIILATGVKDIEPALPNLKDAIKNGQIRHCLICDGYEVIDQKVAIICETKKGINEALLLQSYTPFITVFTLGKKIALTAKEKAKLAETHIEIISDPVIQVTVKDHTITTLQTDKMAYRFDTVYSSLGTVVQTSLAIALGAKHNKDGNLLVNSHQETNIPGLYAIGDIVAGLNQMCVASSHGAIAAVTIFNKLHLHK